jgi:hypothetical protein
LDTPPTTPRDGHGRFASGNQGGPGRPRSPAAELRRAVEEAISPDHAAAIIRRLARKALEGDVAAARLVLERTCGRSAEAPAESKAAGVEFPRLRTAADCSLAIERIADGIAKGTVDLAVAKALIDAIQVRIKTIETQDLEQRLAELEKGAASVEFGDSRRRS